mmetsp:Transcript_12471/g.13840  ORF Transcript_12471/g.13840 Transcript_12471/m.13840 type:complete len:118 (+) Transcript_12471:626-979(+)
MEISPNHIGSRSVASVSATLTMQDGLFQLDTRQNATDTTPPRHLWGSPRLKKVLKLLSEARIVDVRVTEQAESGGSVLIIKSLEAKLILTPTNTEIHTTNATARRILKNIVLQCCYK